MTTNSSREQSSRSQHSDSSTALVDRDSESHSGPAHRTGGEAYHTPDLELVPASDYTTEVLTAAYNQTRVDYIVPMPMNVARLEAYIRDYDCDLTRSVVARTGNEILGLGMLGVRPRRGWITRLGVLPTLRRNGAGEAMMRYLIDRSRELSADSMLLEVIKNNTPAHRLFSKLGFRETRELLILRRPPGLPILSAPPYRVTYGDQNAALDLLPRRTSVPSWLDETPSLRSAGNLLCLEVTLEDGSRGWAVYQSTVFQLGRLVLQTEAGDPAQVGQALAHALHSRHPVQDTNTENIAADDPHLPGLRAMRYMESFRRIEMRLDLAAGGA